MTGRTLRRLRIALWVPLIVFCGFMAVALYGLRHPASTDVRQRARRQAAAGVRSARRGAGQAGADPPATLPPASRACSTSSRAGASRARSNAPQLADARPRRRRDRRRRDPRPARRPRGVPRPQRQSLYAASAADPVGAVQLAIGSSGVPETYVIDGKGVIRYQHIGDIREEQLPMIREKLAEAGK